MIRFCLFSFALLAATGLWATVPSSTNSIGPRSGQPGAPAESINLSQHFTIRGVTFPIVRFDTTFGSFDVALLPEAAPNNVANFLGYVDRGDYDNTIIHRQAFFGEEIGIVQGGAFAVGDPLVDVPAQDPVALEYNEPNVRGTLAAARTNDPDSASASWYFNTIDNTETLGPNEEIDSPGYTTYGRVLGNGMEVVDTMAMINTFALGGAFDEIPLRFYAGGTPTAENFIIIDRVDRVDLYPAGGAAESALAFIATSSNPAVVTVETIGTLLSLTPLSTGTATVTVTATDISGLVAVQEFVYSTGGVNVSSQPANQDVAAESAASFTVVATSGEAITYQWYRRKAGEAGPTLLAGETAASLSLSNVQSNDMGFYFARMRSGTEMVDSAYAGLTITEGSSYLSNLSTRGSIPANGTLIPGFVLQGTGRKALVVRAVGPGLAQFIDQGVMADPTMNMVPLGGTDAVVSNDNWGEAANAADLVSTSVVVGAFPLEAESLDAALLSEFSLPSPANSPGYTVQITSTDPATPGIVLAEIYDPDGAEAVIQLTNVSARGHSGTGADLLSPGFAIAGDGARSILIRVVAPTLALPPYNVEETMTDPRLTVIPAQWNDAIVTNDNWNGDAELKAAFATTGAFPLASDSSRDAAVLVRLPPGAYTVKPEGADGGTGVILVEVYAVGE